jgi:hypothetical protein
MDALIHVANVLFLISYFVRDILWLRVFSVVATGCFLTFFLLQPQIAWVSVGWQVVFMALNCWRVYQLYLERRPCYFDAEDEKLYRLVFRSLRPREFQRLARVGTRHAAQPGELLMAAGERAERVLCLSAGRVAVRSGGETRAELGPGRFVGEMSFLTGEPASADVVALEPCRYLALPAAPLRGFLAEHPELRAAWQLLLGADLAQKLRAA